MVRLAVFNRFCNRSLNSKDLSGPRQDAAQLKTMLTITKRGRGRPKIIREQQTPVPKRRGRPPSIVVPEQISKLLSDNENCSEVFRTRVLANEASRRCRINRKRKLQQALEKVEEETERQCCLFNKIESVTAEILKVMKATKACPYCKKNLLIPES